MLPIVVSVLRSRFGSRGIGLWRPGWWHFFFFLPNIIEQKHTIALFFVFSFFFVFLCFVCARRGKGFVEGLKADSPRARAWESLCGIRTIKVRAPTAAVFVCGIRALSHEVVAIYGRFFVFCWAALMWYHTMAFYVADAVDSFTVMLLYRLCYCTAFLYRFCEVQRWLMWLMVSTGAYERTKNKRHGATFITTVIDTTDADATAVVASDATAAVTAYRYYKI